MVLLADHEFAGSDALFLVLEEDVEERAVDLWQAELQSLAEDIQQAV